MHAAHAPLSSPRTNAGDLLQCQPGWCAVSCTWMVQRLHADSRLCSFLLCKAESAVNVPSCVLHEQGINTQFQARLQTVHVELQCSYFAGVPWAACDMSCRSLLGQSHATPLCSLADYSQTLKIAKFSRHIKHQPTCSAETLHLCMVCMVCSACAHLIYLAVQPTVLSNILCPMLCPTLLHDASIT